MNHRLMTLPGKRKHQANIKKLREPSEEYGRIDDATIFFRRIVTALSLMRAII
jgi:hypothetical protein